MKVFAILLALSGTFVLSHGQSPALPRPLGSVPLPAAAFVEAYLDQGNDTTPMGDRYTLYVSTFNPINGVPDSKYMLRNLGRELKNIANWTLTDIGKTSVWPNSPEFVPFEVFNTHAIIWPYGFLVPPKTHGGLEIYDTSMTPPQRYSNIASNDVSDWSYHRVLWKDMDNDGDLDALTARFFKPILGETKQQLLWLENPNLPLVVPPVHGWTQHILKEQATDVHFRNFKLTSQGQEYDCILSAEFFNEKLMLYYSLDGDWRNWTNTRSIPIDITLGQVFDVYVDDFNQDGKLDFMATAYNHTDGHVFVWEVPENFRNGTFVKHTIADGFKANLIIGGQSMTPGSPKPFYPSQAFADEIIPNPDRHRKHYILVSGDDDGKHYILEPNSEDVDDWTYTKHILVDTEKTTSGKFAVADFDGDGFTDIVAAGYTSGTLYGFTYAPA